MPQPFKKEIKAPTNPNTAKNIIIMIIPIFLGVVNFLSYNFR